MTTGIAESEAVFDQFVSDSTGTASEKPQEVTITFNNEGQSAWRIIGVDGADGDEIVSGDENPTVSLEEGVRYTVDNQGWIAHPLVFTDSDDEILLSQVQDGKFDQDPEVNWEHDDGVASFTLTSELADELARYHCATHVQEMRGEIETSSGSGSFLRERTRSITLESGASETTLEEFDTAGLGAGEYVYGVATEDERLTAQLTVTPLQPYLNEDGIIDTNGLRDAIEDWRASDIDTDLLRQVIDAWRSGEPI